MQIAECNVVISRFGDTVTRHNVTPAEAQYLINEHQATVGRCPVIDLVINGNVVRTPKEEKERLKNRFDGNPDLKKNKVEALFPGNIPNLPETFADVTDAEGNQPFDANGKNIIEAPDVVVVDGKKFSAAELANLVRAGQAALNPAPKPAGNLTGEAAAKASGSKNDQDEEED